MATQRTFTTEEAQKKMASLPEEVMDLLYSPEMSTAIQKVGEKNKLHYDQMGRLEMETTNVMLGFTDTADYPPILAKVLDVDIAAANTIAKDINDILFIKIREAMKTNSHSNTAAIPTLEKSAAIHHASAEKSVVMPSTNKLPMETPRTDAPIHATVPAATPAQITPIPAPVPTLPNVPKPAARLPVVSHVDAMLSEPTVSLAPQSNTAPSTVSLAPKPATPAADITKTDAPKPGPSYAKADPYHEPID